MDNVVEDARVVLADVGWFSLRQLNCEDSKRPHVHFVVVLTASLNEFGSHPADRSDLGLAPLLLLSQHNRVPEVC